MLDPIPASSHVVVEETPASTESSTSTTPAPTPPTSATPASLPRPQGYTTFGRRSHKKSRTGCAVCKARKIKCDEHRPSCVNCITHGVRCPFLDGSPLSSSTSSCRKASSATRTRPRLSRSRPSPSSSPSSQPTQTSILHPTEDDPLPTLELELLHNFTTRTYTTLTADSSLWTFWRDDMVQLGFTCDYIMRAVLAVSALHLAYHRPDKRDWYTAQAILLHQRASRSAMKVMERAEGLDKDETACLFLFSMLTVFFALATPRSPTPSGTFFIGDSGIPDWAFLLSGAKSIMDVLGWERRHETVAAPFLYYGARRWEAHCAKLKAVKEKLGAGAASGSGLESGSCGEGSASGSASNPGLESNIASGPGSITSSVASSLAPGSAAEGISSRLLPLTSLREKISATIPASETDLLKTYLTALDLLEPSLLIITHEHSLSLHDSPHFRHDTKDVLDAMVWLWLVSDSLVPLLREPTKHQEAVVIFAHFCVLLKHYDSHWWLQGWADHLMGRAMEILDEEHRAWIKWPVMEMRWKG